MCKTRFMMLIRVAIRSPLMLIFAIIMAFIMGGKLALIFVVVIPLLGAGLFFIIRSAFPIFRRVFRKYDVLNPLPSRKTCRASAW